jgi:hypothetical protein
MARRFQLLTLISMMSLTMGCASMQDFHYKRSHELSAFCSSLTSKDVPCFDGDLKAGYRQGHFDLSTGRTCKPPTLPPKKYWAPCYQSCKGQQAIANWYRGYELGMIAAEKECGGCFHTIRPHMDGVPTTALREIFPPPTFEDNFRAGTVIPTPPAGSTVPTEMIPLVPQPDAEVKPPRDLFSPPKLTN